MNSRAELIEAMDDFTAGKFGHIPQVHSCRTPREPDTTPRQRLSPTVYSSSTRPSADEALRAQVIVRMILQMFTSPGTDAAVRSSNGS